MSCEDLSTRLFVIVCFHDNYYFVVIQMLEGEVLVLSPLHVPDVGADQCTVDRAPPRSGERHTEDASDGQAWNHHHRQGDTSEETDRRAHRSARTEIDEEFTIGVSLKSDRITRAKSDTQPFTPESSGPQVGDRLFGSMTIGKDCGDVIVS